MYLLWASWTCINLPNGIIVTVYFQIYVSVFTFEVCIKSFLSPYKFPLNNAVYLWNLTKNTNAFSPRLSYVFMCLYVHWVTMTFEYNQESKLNICPFGSLGFSVKSIKSDTPFQTSIEINEVLRCQWNKHYTLSCRDNVSPDV